MKGSQVKGGEWGATFQIVPFLKKNEGGGVETDKNSWTQTEKNRVWRMGVLRSHTGGQYNCHEFISL